MKLWIWAQNWFARRLRAARRTLRAHRIPATVMPIGYKVDWRSVLCRMYVEEGTIYVSGWWMVVGYVLKSRMTTERLFRHELAHTIVHNSKRVQNHYWFPDYPSRRTMLIEELKYVLRGFRDYGRIHPEEEFAEKVSDLDRDVLHQVACLASRP